MKASKAVEIFSAMNPDDEVWLTYLNKDDVAEAFSNYEYTDENDELIETDKFVNNGVVKSILEQVDNNEYLWQQFNESFSDICAETLGDLVAEAREDKELWDTEKANESINSD